MIKMLTVHDFKVGMKVKAIASDPKGLIGEVKYVDTDDTIAVAFEGFDGHNCRSILEKDNGWWMLPKNLEIISNTEETCSLPTAEQDNIEELCAKSDPRLRLLSAYEAYEQAIQMKKDALDEIKQILKEMESI